MTMEDFVKALREEFNGRLQKKTGWGRNEILAEFDNSISFTLARFFTGVSSGKTE